MLIIIYIRKKKYGECGIQNEEEQKKEGTRKGKI